MSTVNQISGSITAKAHQFALDAMREHTASGVLSQLMKNLSSTEIDAVGISISNPNDDRYLVASRGAIGTAAKARIRATLDALSREDDSGLLMPILQTPCNLGLSEVRRIEETYECWYRQFDVADTRLTLVAFHKDQSVVDPYHRSLLQQMSQVVEATMVMLSQKRKARIALVKGPQTLLKVQLDGLSSIRTDFGEFEAREIMEGTAEMIRENLDAVSHVGCTDSHTITVMLPKTEDLLLSEIKLRIAEMIRLYPVPDGYQLDSYMRESQIAGTAERGGPQSHSLHVPTPPRDIVNGIRSIAN